jgi:putative transposase
MAQVARNVTMVDWSFLESGHYLIHDRDGTYCPALQRILEDAGVTRVPLPPRSPHVNAYAERWVRSVKEEGLSRVILFGEPSLRHALKGYTAHYHAERPHQGKENGVLRPAPPPSRQCKGPIRGRERLGGLLQYHDRDAA